MGSLVRRSWFEPKQAVRTLSFIGALVAGVTCSDQPLVAPKHIVAPGHAAFAMAPAFSVLPAGGPTIILSKVRALLISAQNDTLAVEANFQGDSAILLFDVQFTGNSADYTLDLSAFDSQDVLAYHYSESITLKPGDNPSIPTPVLEPAGPYAAIKTVKVSPTSLQLNAGATSNLSVTGADASGHPVTPVVVGWTSRDSTVATVDQNGLVRAGAFQGSTFIVARTVTSITDSIQVKVKAPVAKVLVAPASLQIIRGQSAAVGAELRDAGNHLIDDRTATWNSSDTSIATVSAAGVIQGIKVGAATITATAEGQTGTAAATVVSPIDHVEIMPTSLNLTTLTPTAYVTTKIVPRTGGVVDGIAVSLSSNNPAVATVDANGLVTAIANGNAVITATAETFNATSAVTVNLAGTLLALNVWSAEKLPGGTQQFNVVSGGSGPFTWTVNNVAGGNVTFGSITTSGFYTAPTSVPSPATFDVCAVQANPAEKGCAHVTINPVPTSGADVIVFNDINTFDDGGAYDPNNQLMYRNLVNFTGTGPRVTKTGVMMYSGHQAR